MEKKMKLQALSPKTVKTINDLCRMKSDNWSAGDFWMLVDPPIVTIAAQKSGESRTGKVTMPRKNFDKLIEWYLREQRLAVPNGESKCP